MRVVRLGALMCLSLVVPAEALTLRITSDDGRIEFFQGRKKLSESQWTQLCATAKRRKDEIEFQRDKMTRDDALAAILKEAQCLDARPGSAIRNEPKPAPKSAPHKRAKPRHTAKARR